MMTCICKAVNDKTIRETVQKGAKSLEDVALACDAGTGCGMCRDEIKAMIEREDDHGRGRRGDLLQDK